MHLHNLGPGVYVAESDPSPALTNIGVVVEDDGITLIDTGLSPELADDAAVAIAALGPPVKRIILTSSHIGYVGGTTRFPLAAIYGTRQISAHLDQEPNRESYQRRYPRYGEHFATLRTRPVSHLVAEAAWITPAIVAVPLPGQIAENLVVQVPGANVVFGGALCSFGVTPLAFDGDPAAWADSLDRVSSFAAVIVPGQGPVGGATEIAALQAYLRACGRAEGDPTQLGAGPWERWSCREFDVINVERAALLARGNHEVPASMRHLLGQD